MTAIGFLVRQRGGVGEKGFGGSGCGSDILLKMNVGSKGERRLGFCSIEAGRSMYEV